MLALQRLFVEEQRTTQPTHQMPWRAVVEEVEKLQLIRLGKVEMLVAA